MNRQLIVPVGDAIEAMEEAGADRDLAAVLVHQRCFFYAPLWVIETAWVRQWILSMESAEADVGGS